MTGVQTCALPICPPGPQGPPGSTGGGAAVGPTPPLDPAVGEGWFNTSLIPPQAFIWDGSAWLPVTDLTDYVNNAALMSALADYLPLTGGTLTGDLGLTSPAASSAQLAANWSVVASGSTGDLAAGVTLNTTGADLLILDVGSFGPPDITINDSRGNTWNRIVHANYNEVYYCQGGSVGPNHTISVTNLRPFAAMSVVAFSG